LYTITRKKGYEFKKVINDIEKDVDLGSYLQDLFDSSYSEFILSFGSLDMMESI